MHDRGPASRETLRAFEAIQKIALSYPQTREDFPWGESAFKVKEKVFVFMSASAEGLGFSVKLPDSAKHALKHSFAAPTGYGLGKAGWVSAKFPPGEKIPFELITPWIEESFLAVAPKKIAAEFLGETEAPAMQTKKPARSRGSKAK